MKESCQQFRLAIDDMVDKTVDARIGGGAEPCLDEAVGSHLASCPDCLNYKMANQMIVKAAAETPLLKPRADLTKAIMTELSADFESSQNQQPQIILLMGAFLAFIAITIMEVNDSPWNIASWAVALIFILALKPLLALPHQRKLASHA